MKYQVWYIHQDGRQYGPITERELLYLARLSKLDPDAHVWSVGLPKWRRAGDLEGLYRPPPLPGEEEMQDVPLGPAALHHVAIAKDAPVNAIADRSAENGAATAQATAKSITAPSEHPEDPRPQGEVAPVARRGSAVAAQTLPAREPDPQDHANDNVVKREQEMARRLVGRVAKLEQAIEKEAHDRRRLKSAIEALLDYLATDPNAIVGPPPVPRLATAARTLARPDDDERDLEIDALADDAADDLIAEPALVLQPETSGEPSYLARHWFGEHSLGRSFWVNFFAPSIVLALAVAMVAAATRHSVLWRDFSLVAALIVTVPLFFWMAVGLLRASRRVKLVTGRWLGPKLADAWVLIAVLAWLGAPGLIRFYPTLIPEPILSTIDVTTYWPSSRKGDKAPEGQFQRPSPAPPVDAPAPPTRPQDGPAERDAA